MPIAKVQFTVRGRGPFPFDMLRYDSCWPVGSEDAIKLASNFGDTWELDLWSADITAPTEARWNSFNVQVISSQRRR